MQTSFFSTPFAPPFWLFFGLMFQFSLWVGLESSQLSAQDSTRQEKAKPTSAKPSKTQSLREAYRLAQRYFQEGKIDKCLEVLETQCFTKERRYLFALLSSDLRAEIYELAAMAALILDKPAEGQQHLRQMLENRPFYDRENYILPKMRLAIDTMTIKAKWSVGLHLSLNAAAVQSVADYSVLEPIGYEVGGDQFRTLPAIGLGLSIERGIGKRLSLLMDMGFLRLRYRYRLENASPRIAAFGYVQQINSLNFPLSLRYYFRTTQNWQPYLQAGIFYTSLRASSRLPSATIVRSEENSGSQLAENAAFLATDFLFVNNNFGLTAGAGLHYRLGRVTLGTGLHWQHGLAIVSNRSSRFNANNFNFGYYDASDDIKLHHLNFNLQVVYAIKHRVY
jgi:opacity protein-like surface antigen